VDSWSYWARAKDMRLAWKSVGGGGNGSRMPG